MWVIQRTALKSTIRLHRVDNVPHPCIGICSTSVGDLVCRGCGRSVVEIRDWNSYTNEQKLEVMRRICEVKDGLSNRRM